MKKSELILLSFVLITCSISVSISSCKEKKSDELKVEIREPNDKSFEDSVNEELEDTYYLEEEKHFDCTIEEILKEDQTKEGVFGKYSVVTECGILFYTNKKYKIGDILKGFDSPKHK